MVPEHNGSRFSIFLLSSGRSHYYSYVEDSAMLGFYVVLASVRTHFRLTKRKRIPLNFHLPSRISILKKEKGISRQQSTLPLPTSSLYADYADRGSLSSCSVPETWKSNLEVSSPGRLQKREAPSISIYCLDMQTSPYYTLYFSLL